jgi:hypothetical protein
MGKADVEMVARCGFRWGVLAALAVGACSGGSPRPPPANNGGGDAGTSTDTGALDAGTGAGGGGANDGGTVVDAASDVVGPATCSDTQSDTHNCGACGHDCLGATCSGGLCAAESISSFVTNRLVADDKNLYGPAAGIAVSGVPKTGGSSFVVASQDVDAGTGGPNFFVLSGGQLYWDYWNSSSSLSGSVFSAPTSARGATPTVLFSPHQTSQSYSFPNAFQAGVVGPNLYAVDDCNAILYLPVTGAAAWSPVTDSCYRDFSNTVFDAPSSTAYSLRFSGTIYKWSLPGGTAAQIPLPGSGAESMTVASGKIYVAVQTSSTVYALYSMGLDGSAPTVVATQLPTEVGQIRDLVVDGARAFYQDYVGATNVGARIYRVTLATGEAISMFESSSSSLAFVPSAPYLYIATNSGIVRIAE